MTNDDFLRIIAEKDRALEEAAQRLEARGHKFGAEMARAAIRPSTKQAHFGVVATRQADTGGESPPLNISAFGNSEREIRKRALKFFSQERNP